MGEISQQYRPAQGGGTYFVHDKAHVDKTVKIGLGTHIWQFASVIRGAELGERCNVASGATIDGSKFGDDCIICHNVAMGPGFEFGDNCFVGPNATICNDVWPATHRTGWDIQEIKERPSVIVEDEVSIGANSVILPGVRLGKGCVIAAGSVVNENVGPNQLFSHVNGFLFTYGLQSQEFRDSRRMRFAK